jgi:predicted nucleotidyltransferase
MGISEIQHTIKKHILKVDPDAKIILFGSRARNEANTESDWDLLVLTPKKISTLYKNLIRDELFFVELETNQVISSLIRNEKDWENFQTTSIYKNILNEGIEL